MRKYIAYETDTLETDNMVEWLTPLRISIFGLCKPIR